MLYQNINEQLSNEDRNPIIQLQNVYKTYTTPAGDFAALKGISLDIYPGEFAGIVGRSGAGKSTLLNMITGVDQLTSGEVLVGGFDSQPVVSVHALNENELALWRGRNLGVIYQSFQLLPMLSILDNILLPVDLCGQFKPKESQERAMQLLEMVELEEHADKFPAQISGGQQQRAAIARALANDPPILIADEPTGSLDTLTAETIFKLFESLIQKGKTIVMVTHDNNLGPRFSRHISIVDGHLQNDAIKDAPSSESKEKSNGNGRNPILPFRKL